MKDWRDEGGALGILVAESYPSQGGRSEVGIGQCEICHFDDKYRDINSLNPLPVAALR